MSKYIGLDFETYGATDLPKHGLDRYINCPTFRPLLASTYTMGVRLPVRRRYDLVRDYANASVELRESIGNKYIVAHNAPFERAVLRWMGVDLPASRFVDSAVIARAAGAAGKLEAAAPQLLNVDKLAQGRDLIRLFSIPGKYQEASGSRHFDPQIIEDHPIEWGNFGEYCDVDAMLGYDIAMDFGNYLTDRELEFQAITMEMNDTGWHVDVELVEEMQRRYIENQEVALEEFRSTFAAAELNLNSLKQLKEWCLERGIKATSFDEKNTAKLHARISKKLDDFDAGIATPKANQYEQYTEVLCLLETKQILGGSSLKKLQTILDTQRDGRLKDQYLHCGAGQTLRTTGRSVQMQNLKRLGGEVADVEELFEVDTEWDNEALAKNIRQCFTATEKDGRLIVGDFSSVENRGLAWAAGETKKLDAIRKGMDPYKLLAAEMYGVPYDAVSKEQRQFGKVGELSCGYGAGAGAVQSFAEGMGMVLTEAEAAKVVNDFRMANTQIVAFWFKLDQMLHDVVEGRVSQVQHMLPDGLVLTLQWADTPQSLQDQHPGAQSLQLGVFDNSGTPFLLRFFHGCYMRGRDISYYKPSELKSGDLWKSHFVNPKTKQVEFYKIYGGKLAGIFTQSFCRELFFRSLSQVSTWANSFRDSVQLVGQFHDEIVVDWRPGGRLSLPGAKRDLELMMSDPGRVASFPLAADIKDDYRYTK